MSGIYYEPGASTHDLPFDPFKACVVPRPIGWISTRSRGGVDNLAPYSQFTNLSYDPPSVLFCANQNPDGQRKDSVVNAEETGEFVWNIATWDLREAVNASAENVGPLVDEFERAGLAKAASRRVKPSRVAASPINFECEVITSIRIPGNSAEGTVDVVFGRVLAIHIAENVLDARGRIDPVIMRPLARMGYFDYTSVESRFEMIIPGDPRLLAGLEGAPGRR
ncbi:flavin reductase family protein [Sphingopyxis granuli]|uniref:flavin reductase family protein n=1 Tax=Sphingopyxis granuli TaxID=267128 RepID=UPI00301B865B